ncbi:hypothetical protein COB52_02095 [Candidatus Kaiserbacteria bacterium]|nr:MAG: hypothetical protein COB52_02095 [Candidatus Kaiserbacteria bacterium]
MDQFLKETNNAFGKVSEILREYWALIVVIVILLVVGAFFTYTKNNSADVQVSLKWVHQAQFAGMYTAKDKGYYFRKGLNVTFKEFDFETLPSDDLISGEADFALMSAEEFLLHISSGEELEAIAAIYQVSPYALISMSDSEIDGPADFVGKVLGSKGGKIEEELSYLLLLQGFGIPREDVEIKTLGFGQREIDDLMEGSADVVDIYRTDQLYFFNKEEIDYSIILPERYRININNDLIVARKSFIEENPKVVRKFVAETVKGWEYALENIDEAVDITMEYVTSESYLDRDYEKFILVSSAPLIQPNTNSRIGLINTHQMLKLYEHMQRNEFLDREFMVGDFVTSRFLPN